MAKVPQGYETNINVRLVPGRDVEIPSKPKRYRPREGALRRDAEPLNLPPDLIDKLKNADKDIVAWLAQGEANARLGCCEPRSRRRFAGGLDVNRMVGASCRYTPVPGCNCYRRPCDCVSLLHLSNEDVV